MDHHHTDSTGPVARALPILLVLALTFAAWLLLGLGGHGLAPATSEANVEHFHTATSERMTLAAFLGVWILMTVAMMLPTTLPLVGHFARMTRPRADRARLVSVLLSGYLFAWALVGLVAYGGGVLLQQGLGVVTWVRTNGWIIGAAVFGIAGAYQLSPLKEHCLTQCRSPRLFILERWHGRRERQDAFRIGWGHGIFCVGCCWALMLVMLVMGAASLGWMAAVGGVMALEKNLPGGQHARIPLGIGLLALAAYRFLQGTGVLAS